MISNMINNMISSYSKGTDNVLNPLMQSVSSELLIATDGVFSEKESTSFDHSVVAHLTNTSSCVELRLPKGGNCRFNRGPARERAFFIELDSSFKKIVFGKASAIGVAWPGFHSPSIVSKSTTKLWIHPLSKTWKEFTVYTLYTVPHKSRLQSIRDSFGWIHLIQTVKT